MRMRKEQKGWKEVMTKYLKKEVEKKKE